MQSQRKRKSISHEHELKEVTDSKFDDKEPKKSNNYKNYFI